MVTGPDPKVTESQLCFFFQAMNPPGYAQSSLVAFLQAIQNSLNLEEFQLNKWIPRRQN